MLDMGCYRNFGGSEEQLMIFSEGDLHEGGYMRLASVIEEVNDGTQRSPQRESSDSAPALPSSPTMTRRSVMAAGVLLRVYQVLAPSLAPRGRIFGSKLVLKSEWNEIDSPYFDAPGEAMVQDMNLTNARSKLHVTVI